ncbi:MAG: hypothetical protein MJ202_08290 [Lentisphaeria bacterium]|nr:hypothetical protein [Lentisphaeria bacterium]
MRNFQRTEIVRHATGDRTGYLPPCGSVSIPFEVPTSSGPVSHDIRLIGETDYFWRWRTEWGAPYAIAMVIDDVLTTRDTYHEKYALDFPCHGDNHPRNAYLKFYQGDLEPGAACRLAIPVKATDFHCEGEAGLWLELYFAKEGRHPNDVFDAPDQVVAISFPEGSYDWTVLQKDFTLPKNTVCAILRIGIRKCTGKLLAGSSILQFNGGQNIIPPLAMTQARLEQFNYVGENLSRRDWLECAVEIDGKEIFRGEKYSCIVRRPEYTFPAGALAPGKHIFTLRLLNDYENAIGFVLQGLELHEFGAHDFELVGAPETVTKGKEFTVLLRTNQDNVSVTAAGRTCRYAEKGLHAMKLPALSQAEQTFELRSAGHADSFRVASASAANPPVYLGTGDSIYIPQTMEDMERYLEWYMGNHVGNCICFRHSYRWGGGRSLNEPMWKKTVALLNELEFHYTLMVDGRELPGMTANPPEAMLQGPYYIGRRSHENDGSFCYWHNQIWGRNHFPEPYGDILSRTVNPGGIQPHVRPKRNDFKTWWFFDPEKAQNAKEAAEYFVENLKDAKGDSTRHSGPSTLFRYFFQAGYDCLLAEQMYGPEEVILSALRGASRAYGKQDFGTHLAVQWGSTPADTQSHAERYFLSLATSYLQGATDINTEEGLWRMEERYADYDRCSHTCLIHQDAHQRFRRFMERHPRRGQLVAPVAALQGRYDGWRCFGREDVWGYPGKEWEFSKAEESFDLLKLFFPRSKFSSVYAHDCPDAPQGWYTGMPYGSLDIAPWETDLSQYRAVHLLGWHSWEDGDGQKLLDYVANGGDLLLTRRHLNRSLKRNAPVDYPDDSALDTLLGAGWRTAGGVRVRQIGKGLVRFFATECWPAEEAIREEYLAAMRQQAEAATQKECQRGWILSNEDVEFAAYDLPDGSRRFYLLNIRWWDRKAVQVTYRHGEESTEITVHFGEILEI